MPAFGQRPDPEEGEDVFAILGHLEGLEGGWGHFGSLCVCVCVCLVLVLIKMEGDGEDLLLAAAAG
jgi:hypothetical protein